MTTINESGLRTIASTSADAKVLFDRLKDIMPGEKITYSELSEIIGRNVREYCKSALYTARRMCLEQHRIVFDSIPDVGLKRLENHEIPKLSRQGFRRIRSTAKKYTKITLCADYEQLSAEDRLEFNYALTGLEPIRELTSSTAEKRIKHAIADAPLPTGKTLELFTRS